MFVWMAWWWDTSILVSSHSRGRLCLPLLAKVGRSGSLLESWWCPSVVESSPFICALLCCGKMTKKWDFCGISNCVKDWIVLHIDGWLVVLQYSDL
jgi:hypothetical protein